MWTAVKRPISYDDDHDLEKENQEYNRHEHRRFRYLLKYIKLILYLPRIQEIKQLQEHKQIEHKRIMPTWSVHMVQGVIIICLPKILISSS